jgi:periplasmic divalent cation tolerance protein
MICVIQWTSSSQEEARTVIKGLLENKFIACAQMLPSIESHFIWKKELNVATEVLVLLKTREEKFTQVKEFIQKNCSYEVPEILLIRCDAGNKEYLDWVSESTA